MRRSCAQIEIYLERNEQMAKKKTATKKGRQMVKRKKAAKKPKPIAAKKPLEYKHITVEIAFTDGGITTATFYKLADCFRYIEQVVTEDYADSIRVELF